MTRHAGYGMIIQAGSIGETTEGGLVGGGGPGGFRSCSTCCEALEPQGWR
jgi:hypothetical protein